jgi:RNA polymerase sigma-70 factor (ECF subfamily)
MDKSASDAELVAGSLKGEDAAFTILMPRYKERLYRFIRRYVGDRDEAYDVLQESFLAAWNALERYDAEKSFSAWLYRIALNKCRDWSRRRLVRKWLTHSDPIDDEAGLALVDNQLLPDAAQEERQQLSRLDNAIAALPKALKEPLVLTVFDGCSHEEAAAILKMTAKAVEVRVYRARKILAEKLRIAD